MAWTAADIPEQKGRVAVVTGANGGLGLESARALAGAGAHVVMAARNQEKAAAAVADIRVTVPGATLEVVALDLGSLASIEKAAATINEKHREIHILMNNAGLMAIPERRTDDGFEMQLGVNHLGHFALTARLLPNLVAGAARIVSVTSFGHHLGLPVRANDPHREGRYGPWRAYNDSKLANYFFAFGLQQRFEKARVGSSSLLAHPGLSNTELQATSVKESGGLSHRFFLFLARTIGMHPARGALPQLRAATDPNAKGGEFYGPRFMSAGPPVRLPVLRRIGLEGAVSSLWAVSERETGLSFDL